MVASRFESDGVPPGSQGWVIEVHEDGSGKHYEVELMDDEGRTTALIVADETELEVLSPA